MSRRLKAVEPPDSDKRSKRLAEIRQLKMARSAHAYVRGSTSRFYDWLLANQKAAIPKGPNIWICGDCHTGNLGPVTDAEGNIDVQIRDLDQTTIGNPALDVIRLGLSVATSIRGSNLPGVTTALALRAILVGYVSALTANTIREEMPQPVRQVVAKSVRRRWRHLAEERIKDAHSYFPLGKRFWPVTAQERDAIDALFADTAVIELVRLMRKNLDNAEVVVEDCAYWMKGCSSLGNLRYAVLLKVTDPKSEKSSRCIIDIKQAVTPLSPSEYAAEMPSKPGDRVVAGARHLSPNLGDRMLATELLNRSVFLRELAPQDLKFDLDTVGLDDAVAIARYLGAVVGVAHARQLPVAVRKRWAKRAAGNPEKAEAPSWLWKNVTELVGSHEIGYLEHCRRYALAAEVEKPGFVETRAATEPATLSEHL